MSRSFAHKHIAEPATASEILSALGVTEQDYVVLRRVFPQLGLRKRAVVSRRRFLGVAGEAAATIRAKTAVEPEPVLGSDSEGKPKSKQ